MAEEWNWKRVSFNKASEVTEGCRFNPPQADCPRYKNGVPPFGGTSVLRLVGRTEDRLSGADATRNPEAFSPGEDPVG
jgi:hypothetical protein